MGEGCRGTTKPKAPKPPKDEAYLESVIEKRIRLFESIKAQQNEARKNIADETIRVTLPDGKVKEGKKWITSPMDIAKEISKSLAANALISQGCDGHGRIYVNEQKTNAQISSAVSGHAYPRLKLPYKSSLVQLEGGTSHLPLLDSAMRATPLSPS